MPRALDDIRILDLTHVLAGPFCTYQLGLLGAHIIKVEEPRAGDYMRTRGADEALRTSFMGDHFQSQNANKRSLAIDLQTPEGIAVVRQLLAQCDVVVENFRAGATEALGVGPDEAASINPRLVYCRITAYGSDGPMGTYRAYDNVVQAMSGLMSVTGTKASGPLKAGAPVLDYATGTMAAMAILGALLRRERFGEAQRLDVSMLDTALQLMSPAVTSFLGSGKAPSGHGNDHPLAAASCYTAKDGVLIMLGSCTQRQFETLCHLINRNDLLADPRFSRVRYQDPHRQALADEIAVTMKSRTAADWESLLAPHVPAARVRSLDEALSLPQLAFRGLLARTGGPEEGLAVPQASYLADADGPEITCDPPTLGEHSLEILKEAGLDEAAIADLIGRGIVRVADDQH